jgi:hypothetical protein
MSVPSSSRRSKALVAAHDLAVDQDRPDPEMVHGLDDQWIPGSPVMTVAGPAGDFPQDRGARHQPVAIVLDLMNPVGP